MPDTNERHDELPSITLGEVFTDEQISLARTLFKNASEKLFSRVFDKRFDGIGGQTEPAKNQ